MSQASFQKQQRERARKEKAALKAARKEERRAEAGTDEDAPTSESEQAKVLESLAALHARFEDGGMTFEDFEAARDELTAKLSI
jgi:uncharacterized iron-regulated protein